MSIIAQRMRNQEKEAGAKWQQPPACGTPKRIEWIDNARCIAAFLVVYVHWRWRIDVPESNGHDLLNNYAYFSTLYGNVPFFLILTGYFLNRNITWGKAWRRFIWLLVPFVLLNLCVYGVGLLSGRPAESLCSILGLGHIFTHGGVAIDPSATVPVIVPSWFLRDVMLLSLITPLLDKIKPLVICGICFAFSCMAWQVPLDPSCVLNPGTCIFFALGVCMSRINIGAWSAWVEKGRTLVFALLFIVASVYSLYSVECFHHGARATLFGMLAGAAMIGYAGMLIERYMPRFSKVLSSYGPACFFVYMFHHPILTALQTWGPRVVVYSIPALLIPAVVYVGLLLLYRQVKRFAPWLLPFVALERNAPSK